jgi:hypothetical protein
MMETWRRGRGPVHGNNSTSLAMGRADAEQRDVAAA